MKNREIISKGDVVEVSSPRSIEGGPELDGIVALVGEIDGVVALVSDTWPTSSVFVKVGSTGLVVDIDKKEEPTEYHVLMQGQKLIFYRNYLKKIA